MRAIADPSAPPVRGKKLVFHGADEPRLGTAGRGRKSADEPRKPIKPPMKVRKGHSGKAIVLPGSRMAPSGRAKSAGPSRMKGRK